MSKLEALRRLGLSRVGKLLDIGCGTGLSLRFEGSTYAVGLDISSKMLELASVKGFEVVQGDMLSLPFRGDSFDMVTMVTSLHHAIRKEKALAEACHVLKSRGMLGLSMLKAAGGIRQADSLKSLPEIEILAIEDGEKDGFLTARKRDFSF